MAPTPQSGVDTGHKEVARTPEGVERMESRSVFTPPVDIRETEEALFLTADVPGAAAADIDITLEKHTLTLKAKVAAQPPQGYSPAYAEYEIGDFERTFHVSEDIDPDAIGAAVDNGVLTVTLPKRAPRTRRIAIAGK